MRVRHAFEVRETGPGCSTVWLDVDVQTERLVFAVVQLDDAGDADEVDASPEIEAPDDRRARQDQDRQTLEAIDESVRDSPTAAQVAQAEAVVAVDQDPCVVESFDHADPLIAGMGRRGAPSPARSKTGIIHDYALV